KTDEAIRILKAHEAEIRARGVRRLALCGSTARGDARPDSDVDVLVSIPPDLKFSLIDQASLQVLMSDFIGREVDVLIEEDLKPRLRAAIEQDRVEVFG
ncbi:MAG: nucleotidyltransferase, partial [Alphaproteobacteria bacterium]|nr:nucleotidyltransferase [Alphaproteobacteria bacterium]